jgi:hypothetical protein
MIDLNLADYKDFYIALEVTPPTNPPISPPRKNPKTGIGIKALPIKPPTNPVPREVVDPNNNPPKSCNFFLSLLN